MSPPGSALQRALSDLVGTEVLLVKSSPQTFRRVLGGQQFLNDVFNALPEYPLEYPLEECTTEFADGYPFLVATEETFDAVEKWLIEKTDDVRIQKPELIERYRPNIVIKGGEKAGFEEDGWEEIKCGGTETLFPVSRCPRCPVSLHQASTLHDSTARVTASDTFHTFFDVDAERFAPDWSHERGAYARQGCRDFQKRRRQDRESP